MLRQCSSGPTLSRTCRLPAQGVQRASDDMSAGCGSRPILTHAASRQTSAVGHGSERQKGHRVMQVDVMPVMPVSVSACSAMVVLVAVSTACCGAWAVPRARQCSELLAPIRASNARVKGKDEYDMIMDSVMHQMLTLEQ